MARVTDEEAQRNRDKIARSYVILKSNLLFQFPDERAEHCKNVVCLDGFEVTTEQKKSNGKPIFKANNAIVLHKPQLNRAMDFTLSFDTGKDTEDWYIALCKASNLGSKKETTDAKRSSEFWTQMSSRLTNYDVDPAPHWLTAIVCRLWWNIHDSEGFIEFVGDKFKKKLSKIKKPPLVGDIKVQEISFGPNLPTLKNVKLLSVTQDGEVSADAEVFYHGGFHLTIEINFLISLAGHSLNFPAVLSVSVQSISGKLHFFCSPPPSNRFWIGFYEEPIIELTVNTEIGVENTKIKNLPKLANIIVHKIKQELIELMVLPNMDDYPIPKVKSDLPKNSPFSPAKLNVTSAAQLTKARSESLPSVSLRVSKEELDSRKVDEKLQKEIETFEIDGPSPIVAKKNK
eukprot:TRINITY_DN5236_c0_g1_i2.p1 TRINITY_DN5236_c0_g1~~TRINITY_DN5236_c0_g1_i2.p1  ORF type:complete len:401 (-),score=109.65 TRINITY_DN5236_c0_g1_i2:63-1265(-)